MVKDDDFIYKYTSSDAEEDGLLVDVSKWNKGLFKYVTTNLLSKGYLNEDKINIPNLTDLLWQCWYIVKVESKNFKKFDYFFSGEVEFPNGTKREVFIEQNETGKYTIMLPEDR